MTEERIKRKELWKQLSKIKKKKVWIRAAWELGLEVTQPKGGSSHYVIRLPGYKKSDIKGVVSTVYDPVRRQVSEYIFKKLLDEGFEEDEIWRAIGFLKDNS